MTTEEKKPLVVQITKGPKWKHILTSIVPFGYEAEFTLRLAEKENKFKLIVNAFPTGKNEFIIGHVHRYLHEFFDFLQIYIDKQNVKTQIYLIGTYDADNGEGTGLFYPIFFDKKEDGALNFDYPTNKLIPLTVLPIEIKSLIEYQFSMANQPKKTEGITDAQMAELKKVIMNSPDGDDFGRKAICWLLDKSEHLTRRVALSFSTTYSRQGKAASKVAQELINKNHSSYLWQIVNDESLHDLYQLTTSAGSYNESTRQFRGQPDDGYTIWISWERYDHAAYVYHVDQDLINKIRNYKIDEPVAITDEQMAELKKIVMKSPDGDDFGKKAICWLLGKSENLTKRVALTFSKEFRKQAHSAFRAAHDMSSAMGSTHLEEHLRKIPSDFNFKSGTGYYIGNEWLGGFAGGGTVWLTNVESFSDHKAQIIRADAEIVKEIENYALKIAAAAKPSATDEKIRNLKAAILADEQRISPFCRKVLLWLIDDSKFTMPSELIFSEEFGNFGKETYETFKDAGKDDIDSYQNVLDQLFADLSTDFSITALLHSGINNKYSIRLAPPKAEEKLMHMKTVDAKLLNEIQGIPLK